MKAPNTLKTLNTELSDKGVLTVTIDVPGETLNVYNQQLIEDFEQISVHIENEDTIKAVIFISGKTEGFMAGADIKMLNQAKQKEDGQSISVTGHILLQRISNSRKPFIAAIHGVCLGAGYELALACHYRIATNDPSTKIGLPEVMLGLLPGGGGTSRLPRLIALPNALDLLLTGKQLNAKRALRMGLVDEVIPEKILHATAELTAERLMELDYIERKQPLINHILRLPIIKDIIINKAKQEVIKKTQGLYPAPLAILSIVQRGLNKPLSDSLDIEAEKFGELTVSPQAKQLINLYFATTELKKEQYVSNRIKAKTIKTLGILGGGLMGAGIATVSIEKAGTSVRLKDISHENLMKTVQHIDNYYKQRLEKKILSQESAKQKMNLLSTSLDYTGFKGCDLIIEAVFEDLPLKHQMIEDIESLGNENTIFASNTSSIPLTDIAAKSKRPENILGMHYFSPVEKMPLLEIIRHPKTSKKALVTAIKFGKEQGKTVIVVKDGAGFYVNRILVPYINAALELGVKGVAFDKIDDALVSFGFPIGPIKLLDEVGVDIGSKTVSILVDSFGERMQSPSIQQTLVKNKRLGKKTKKGFYRYDKPSYYKKNYHSTIDPNVYTELKLTPTNEMCSEDIVDYCIYPLLNESARCLDEQVIFSARDGDIGAVFGIGFPAFYGGPFRYMDSLGGDKLLERFKKLEEKYGKKYQAADYLIKLNNNQHTFYPV